MLLISSILLNDTVQITETPGEVKREKDGGRSLGSGRKQGLPGGGLPVQGLMSARDMQMCQQGPFLTPTALPWRVALGAPSTPHMLGRPHQGTGSHTAL